MTYLTIVASFERSRRCAASTAETIAPSRADKSHISSVTKNFRARLKKAVGPFDAETAMTCLGPDEISCVDGEVLTVGAVASFASGSCLLDLISIAFEGVDWLEGLALLPFSSVCAVFRDSETTSSRGDWRSVSLDDESLPCFVDMLWWELLRCSNYFTRLRHRIWRLYPLQEMHWRWQNCRSLL